MKTFDRIMGLSPNVAIPGNPDYEVYRVGLKWTAVGLFAVAGGLTGDGFHVEVGSGIALGGAPVLWLGGMTVAAEASELSED